jgi:tRNA uracil 4-sulfurtransferase
MDQIYVIRYGEISLKGRNRIDFENKLVRNIEKVLKETGEKYKVKRVHNRIYVDCTLDVFNRVFGIVSYSLAKEIDFDVECIKKVVKELLTGKEFDSFRISTKRMDDTIKISSMDLDKEIGAFVVSEFDKKVSLKEFDIEVGIEARAGKAYVFLEKFKGLGGLPVGVSSSVYCKIDCNRDLLAALLVMKRGCDIIVDKEWPLLAKYHPGSLKIGSVDDSDVIVVGDTIETLRNYGDKFVLRPLITFSDEEIDNLLNEYDK